MKFSFCGNYQTFETFQYQIPKRSLGPFGFARKSNSKFTKYIFSTFSHPASETGHKNATIIQLLFINYCHQTDKIDFYSSCNRQIFNLQHYAVMPEHQREFKCTYHVYTENPDVALSPGPKLHSNR